ncbi:fimbrial protein [Cupriavidus sp. 2KB_3]|uniref:fimbrial protein n=1 Tax=Cupriavidus TaxID=106589 RepID=UPI0011F02ED8|nr:fimbrial protein [Cupriavidus campinensis]
MNKQVLQGVVAALVAMGAASTAMAQAVVTQGQVNFNGRLTGQTCSITAGDRTKTVTLPAISIASLATKGLTAGSRPFSISVENCPVGVNSVSAHWEITNLNPETGNARNLATTNPAGSVEVQLLDHDGAVLRLGDSGKPIQVTRTAADAVGTATLHYGGRYYATGATSAGVVSTTANFTLAYN